MTPLKTPYPRGMIPLSRGDNPLFPTGIIPLSKSGPTTIRRLELWSITYFLPYVFWQYYHGIRHYSVIIYSRAKLPGRNMGASGGQTKKEIFRSASRPARIYDETKNDNFYI